MPVKSACHLPKAKREAIRLEGLVAKHSGREIATNPYRARSWESTLWIQGHRGESEDSLDKNVKA